MTETNESLKDSLFIDEEEEKEELPPAMPEKLPSLIKLLVSRTPRHLQASRGSCRISIACSPPLSGAL